MKTNGSFVNLMIIIDKIRLMAWAPTVAMATPFTPISNTDTKTTSPITLITQAIMTKTNGRIELPMPLNIQLSRLYPTIKIKPLQHIDKY